MQNQNPEAGPLEFSEWPPSRVERLLKQGVEQGLWSADLWNRDLTISGARLLDERFPPLAERLAETGEPLAIEIEDASDEALARLAPLRETLRELVVHGGEFTETGLAHLSHLEHLESLRLAGLPVTDDGLAHLSRLRKLRLLDLSQDACDGCRLETSARADGAGAPRAVRDRAQRRLPGTLAGVAQAPRARIHRQRDHVSAVPRGTAGRGAGMKPAIGSDRAARPRVRRSARNFLQFASGPIDWWIVSGGSMAPGEPLRCAFRIRLPFPLRGARPGA